MSDVKSLEARGNFSEYNSRQSQTILEIQRLRRYIGRQRGRIGRGRDRERERETTKNKDSVATVMLERERGVRD